VRTGGERSGPCSRRDRARRREGCAPSRVAVAPGRGVRAGERVQHYLWRAVDHEARCSRLFVTKRRDKSGACDSQELMKRHGGRGVVTDKLRPTARPSRSGRRGPAVTDAGRTTGLENSHQPFPTMERAMLRFRRMHSACRSSPPCTRRPQPLQLHSTRTHLSSRPRYKEARRRLAEWRALCAG
jgi:hypothetical protein